MTTIRHHHAHVPFIPSPVPFLVFFGFVFAAVAAAGFLFSHPFLLLLLLWFGAHRMSRRHGRRWHRGGHACAPTPRRRTRWSPSAYDRARDAVERSTSLSDERRAELLKTLQDGLDEVASLDAARARLDGFGEVARKAEQRAAKFEADCNRLAASLAALEIQRGDTSAMDDLSAAVDDLTGRVDAHDEVESL